MKTIKEESCLNDGARDGEAIDSMTAVEYLEKQLELEKEARELMPYDPNICTYTIGALHQQVYACLTCRENDTKKPYQWNYFQKEILLAIVEPLE
ncbi:hypothetical protein PACTADRAFT_3825 [Pachysolen tannophilus NRRL Y-2460]|uniref:Uncharacterized protein n=1 Tax=Pachysolen tannophilus NRRL Y-2460 TaxID=669874 RepID=A0A1E4TT63_PACTA|nr:hypothetical protein PACTADRAFT_3825 [Pachysolen tannophilus NRRL Y-2460]